MKKILVLIFFIPGFTNCQSINPPGTIKINDSLYIDSTPITNFMFLEYLMSKDHFEKKGFKSYEEYSKANSENIDYEKAIFEYDYPSPFLIKMSISNKYLERKNYYKDTLYINHPILNISKEQAIDYCKWRTEVVRDFWFSKKDDEAKRNIAKKILYRLPSKGELLHAKAWFKERNELVNFKNKRLLRTNFTYEPKGYRVIPILEFTLNDNLFINEGINKRNFIGFRCVCEIDE